MRISFDRTLPLGSVLATGCVYAMPAAEFYGNAPIDTKSSICGDPMDTLCGGDVIGRSGPLLEKDFRCPVVVWDCRET